MRSERVEDRNLCAKVLELQYRLANDDNIRESTSAKYVGCYSLPKILCGYKRIFELKFVDNKFNGKVFRIFFIKGRDRGDFIAYPYFIWVDSRGRDLYQPSDLRQERELSGYIRAQVSSRLREGFVMVSLGF